MQHTPEAIQASLTQLLKDLHEAKALTSKDVLVIGTSTSEVMGEHIGTNGSQEAAEAIFSALRAYQQTSGVQLAFQCCEHLNRALLIERDVAEGRGYDPVSAIPVRKAGGAMAEYAFSQMDEPVLVEHIRAEAGIDIGDTLIGMHLREVAVPVRSKVKEVGQAHVTMAITRPKLIGGMRAVYE